MNINENTLYELLLSAEMISYLKSVFNNHMLTTGKFDYITYEDLLHDFYIHILEKLRKKEQKCTQEQLNAYFTPALLKTSIKNFAIDQLIAKRNRLSSDDMETDVKNYVMEVVASSPNGTQLSSLSSYVSEINDEGELARIFDEVSRNLNEIQTSIFQCIFMPPPEYSEFFQFYKIDLADTYAENREEMRNIYEGKIIAKFLEIGMRTYWESVDRIKEVVGEYLER